MRSAVWLIVALLAGTCAAGGAETSAFTFDDAASVKSWTFHNCPEHPGATGGIDWLGTDGHTRPGCLRLHYEFAKGGNYVQAISPDVTKDDIGGLRLGLKKGAPHKITFRATDSAGQTFQKGINYEYDGWQEIEVGFSRWDTWFGGAADGKAKTPFRSFGILIENTAEPKAGDLLIDDVRCLSRSESPATPMVTFLASDFVNEPAWSPAGGAGNRLDKGDWQFAFNPGSSPAIHTNFSIPGKPANLRLVVDSEVAGIAITAMLASHFGGFQREIGVLNGQAGQVIEVPLGDMKTWKSQNAWGDTVRLPLRVQYLSLQRGPGPRQGHIRPRRLEIDTELPPGLDVLIYPDAWIADGQACFKARVRNLAASDCEGTLQCRYAALRGTLSEERRPMTLAGGCAWQTVEFHRPMEGRPFLDATFQWISSGGASVPVSIGVATEPDGLASAAVDPDSPVGMGLYLYRFFGWPNVREPLERVTTLAQRAGVKWSREEFNWGRLEPRRGEFDWAFYDQMVDTARKHGISVYGLLAYWSGWTKPYTDEGIEDYCRFAREVVRHYQGRVRYWEVYNEPNISFWSGPKEMYARLLSKAYAAIKAENPDAVVLGCSTAGVDRDFIRKTVELGGRFDELTVHPYRARLEEETFIRDLREVRDLVGGKRVWITEVGFPTQLFSGVTEREQASVVVRTYLAAIASGAVANTSWYDFRNDGVDPLYNEENFGIVRNDFRPKPAYRAFATLGRLIEGLRYVESVKLGPGVDAFRFANDRACVVAISSPDADHVVTVEHQGLKSAVDMMGSPLAGVAADALTIPLAAGMPVYLEGPAGLKFNATVSPAPLTSRKQVHPGEVLRIVADSGVEVKDWEVPPGWPVPNRSGAGTYEIKLPDSATMGQVELVARTGQTPERVSLRFIVVPRLLRL